MTVNRSSVSFSMIPDTTVSTTDSNTSAQKAFLQGNGVFQNVAKSATTVSSISGKEIDDISFPTSYTPTWYREDRVDFYQHCKEILKGYGWEIDLQKLENYANTEVDIKDVIDVDVSFSTPSVAKNDQTGKMVELGSKKALGSKQVTELESKKVVRVVREDEENVEKDLEAAKSQKPIDLSIEYIYDPNSKEKFKFRNPLTDSKDGTAILLLEEHFQSASEKDAERLRLINIARILAYNVINFSFFPDPGQQNWFIDSEDGKTTIGEDDESFAIVECMKRYEKSLSDEDGNGGECWCNANFLLGMTIEKMEIMFKPSGKCADFKNGVNKPAGPLPLLGLRLKALHSLGEMYKALGEMKKIEKFEGGIKETMYDILQEDHSLKPLKLFLAMCVLKTKQVAQQVVAQEVVSTPQDIGMMDLNIVHNVEKVKTSMEELLESNSSDLRSGSGLFSRSFPITRQPISCTVFVGLIASFCPAFRDITAGLEIAKRPQLTISMLFADKLLNFIDTELLTAFADYRLPQLFLTKNFFKNTEGMDNEKSVDIDILKGTMQQNIHLKRNSAQEICIRVGTILCASKLTEILAKKHSIRLRAADIDYYIWRKCIEEEGKGLLLPFPKIRTFCY